ncbi:hypothetical protein VTJ83DRAFT_981 [Remersonia thermophila]|uniref:Xaa-Pro aminopeptidase n=1 Tax=Remersonia thermophila TaxID=72144 RepID=A0ABR4DMQ7_9PEZI
MSSREPAKDLSYRLVHVEEFDALNIEIPKDVGDAKDGPSDAARSDDGIDRAWLYKRLGKYPAKEHARKVAKELGVDSGIIFLPGQVEKLYEDSDMTFEFRQRRYFYYLTGVNVPGCAVTYDIESDYLVLWAPHSDPRTVLWYGKKPSVEQYLSASDLDHVADIQTMASTLSGIVRSGPDPKPTLYVLSPSQRPPLDLPEGVAVSIDTTSLKMAMDCARVIKTEHEIALIRRANAISSGAHKAVLHALSKCRTETDISAIYHSYCLAHGAMRQAYPAIVASGINASTLHYDNNDQPLKGRQLVVLDAGAEWNCYASDVTRTLPLPRIKGTSGGEGKLSFSPEAAAIYKAVYRMQKECIDLVRPGVAFYALHVHACRVAVEELLRLGILYNGTVDEILSLGTVTAFFPHGLGHHVGLEVHDVSGPRRLLSGSSDASATDPLTAMAMALGVAPAAPAGAPRQAAAAAAAQKREFLTPQQAGSLYKAAVELKRTGGDGGKRKGRQTLEKNMVVTIEPGIYFCREYISAFFLSHPVHSRHIDTAVLERYWDVGGVRIEDDILVTEDGYENLTTAPKWPVASH